MNGLNGDETVHGVIVQMPLDSDHPMDSHLITDAVSPAKDVDGSANSTLHIYAQRPKVLLI